MRKKCLDNLKFSAQIEVKWGKRKQRESNEVGKTRIRRDYEKRNYTKSDNEQEILGSHDRLLPEG